VDLLDLLLGHDGWTTGRLLDLSRALDDAWLDKEFDVGHRTLRATFGHMVSGVEFWTAMMAGQPVEMRRDDDRSLAALIEGHERSYAAFAGEARRLSDEWRLDDAFVHPRTGRETFGATLVHVVLHNGQHRGEALHILERLGVPDLPEADPQEWERETRGGEPSGGRS
jgi:uncharacterized damage-inducible protein DinB